MANFNEIEEARTLLGLGNSATLKEIKRAYSTLAHRHHPDKRGGDESETMKQLNRAYKLLMDYCKEYKYSFGEEDVARTYPHDEYLRTFKEKWYNSI